MTATATELFGDQLAYSKAGGKETLVRRYRVSGHDNLVDAASATGLPVQGDAYGTTNLKVAKVDISAYTETEAFATITYEYDEDKVLVPAAGDEEANIDMTAVTVRIRKAYSQATYGPIARDVGTTVGARADGAEGVDIYAPAGQLTISRWIDEGDLDHTRIENLWKHVGQVNSASYYGAAAGVLLYAGWRKTGRQNGLIRIECTFLASHNESESDLPTYSDINGNAFTITGGKKGWQYLWEDFGEYGGEVEVSYGIRGVYVASVYRTDDFSDLGLSGTLPWLA